MRYRRNFSAQSFVFVLVRFCPALIFLLSLANSASAQISIVGVSNKQIYVDSVSFTVNSEAGYDYTVELNGKSIPIDVVIEVSEADYYELYVYRQNQSTHAEESVLVQFVVRASERAETEIGLPVFTPYPNIDSAAAEFTGAQLQIVCPNDYPLGLEIPVIARVENGMGKRLGVNGYVTAAGFEDYPLQLFRGIGSVFLPPVSASGIISYTAQIQTLQASGQINIEESTTWQTASADITSSVNWGQDARIHITAADDVMTISSGATLTIGSGSVIIIDPDVSIQVLGQIIVNGTIQDPVVFTAQDRVEPWGGFLFETASSTGQFTGSIFTASGADPGWFNSNHTGDFTHHDEECLFYLSNSAHVTLTNCFAVENYGQLGHGETGYLTMTGCLVQKFVTGGQYNSGSVISEDSAFIEFPSATAPFVDYDNDAFYLNGGPHSFTDCLFGWTLDDGIDAGEGAAGTVNLEGCWFESCIHEGQAWSSGPRYGDVNNTVVLNCGQGIEAGYGSPFIDVFNTLCTSNAVGARFCDNYTNRVYNGFLTVTDSLLLFNIRDVWGMAFDNWTLHLSQMDIQNNYLSVQNDNHPNNTLWDANDPNHLEQLEKFLPTPAGTVGIGIATLEDTYPISELGSKVPVRLSTFTTNTVTVDYNIYAEDGLYGSGSLQFIPGQTVKQIEYVLPPVENLKEFRIVLSNPLNAEITRYKQVTYLIPYEISEQLIQVGDVWNYFKGTQEPPEGWNLPGFVPDGSWFEASTPIGYETSSGYEGCLATNLSDMRNNYISVFARREFYIEDPCRLTSLTFSIDFDDGYIAYLNGIEVDSRYPPNPVAYNQPASTSNHEACCGTGTPSGPCPPEQVDLSGYISQLVAGYNVLALQVHNQASSSSDFIFTPELSSVIKPLPGDMEPDGDVDFVDFAEFALRWLQNGCGICSHADLTGDGNVNGRDLQQFCDNWLGGL